MDEGGCRKGACLSEKAQCGGPQERAPLLGTPKVTLRKVLEWAPGSIRALLLGNMEGHSFHKASEVNRYINRYVKMACKQVSLSIGALLGNLQGIRLLGLLERKT
jgi:hypothetical protein